MDFLGFNNLVVDPITGEVREIKRSDSISFAINIMVTNDNYTNKLPIVTIFDNGVKDLLGSIDARDYFYNVDYEKDFKENIKYKVFDIIVGIWHHMKEVGWGRSGWNAKKIFFNMLDFTQKDNNDGDDEEKEKEK